MENRTSETIAGVVMILIALGVAGYFGIQEYQRWSFKRAYGEAVTTMCLPPGGGQANLNNAPFEDKPWRVVVMDEDRRHSWHKDLPAEARAEDRAALDLVVCVLEKHKQVVGDCPYLSTGGTQFNIRRVQAYQDLVVLNVESGRRVADLRVWGAAPGPCPDTYFGTTNDTIDGSDPQFRDFYYVIMNLVWR